ncbi:MAG: amino acid ABC transporter ATP-binding protein [Proteobacteria bacterium]|nr:amino acid ABC transporter ATP-binding protein [Pseudomonadota bacterium]MBU1056691.1 amino acid ABC transporter ATP-binding protein [Pseudomonadota bacterium]
MTVPILFARDICVTIGSNEILKNVSLSLPKGSLKVLIGPSGAGKSTFLQTLNHLIPHDSGCLELNGKEINLNNKRELYAYRQQVGMIFQDFNLFDHLNALDNVAIALRKVKGVERQTAHNRAMQELKRVGLEDKATLYPAELSGGQKQRVAIARALAMDPTVLLLDEPTSALDPELIGEVLAVIRDLTRDGLTMVMATHQMDFARALAHEIVFMQDGEIIEQGSPEELLQEGTSSRTRDFCARLVTAIDDKR